MRKYIDIEVTEEDIFSGRPINPRECPVALAVRRKYPMASRIDVGYRVIAIGDAVFYISQNLNLQIHRFDEIGDMKPGTYRAYDTPHI